MNNRLRFGAGIILLASTVIVNHAWSEEKQFSQDWLKCEQSSECVVVESVCGGWACVNQLHSQDTQEYYKRMATLVKCMPIDPKGSQPPLPVCSKNKCVCETVVGSGPK